MRSMTALVIVDLAGDFNVMLYGGLNVIANLAVKRTVNSRWTNTRPKIKHVALVKINCVEAAGHSTPRDFFGAYEFRHSLLELVRHGHRLGTYGSCRERD